MAHVEQPLGHLVLRVTTLPDARTWALFPQNRTPSTPPLMSGHVAPSMADEFAACARLLAGLPALEDDPCPTQ